MAEQAQPTIDDTGPRLEDLPVDEPTQPAEKDDPDRIRPLNGGWNGQDEPLPAN